MIDRRQIYQDFQAAFPKEHLVEMTLTQVLRQIWW